MGKFRIILADSDEGYMQSLLDYMSSFYSHRFEINSFTKFDYLIKFLTESEKIYDLLLITPEFYSQGIPVNKAINTALLASGKFVAEDGELRMVNKYQHVEKLMGEITEVLSEGQKNEFFISGNKGTKVVGVYSAAGGSGRTSVALGCSIQSALRGFRVFYLNLESISSTPAFFKCDNQKSLSKILYYLKEKNKNISLKIEGTRCVDEKYNIHYFSPMDASFDMEEVLPEELEQLVTSLKSMGQYDYVFIDICNGFSIKNLRIMEACDRILLLCTQDRISNIKYKLILEQLNRLSLKNKNNFIEKSALIINKYQETRPFHSKDWIQEGEAFFKVPYIQLEDSNLVSCVEHGSFAGMMGTIIEEAL